MPCSDCLPKLRLRCFCDSVPPVSLDSLPPGMLWSPVMGWPVMLSVLTLYFCCLNNLSLYSSFFFKDQLKQHFICPVIRVNSRPVSIHRFLIDSMSSAPLLCITVNCLGACLVTQHRRRQRPHLASFHLSPEGSKSRWV